jgi:hypothetical protein
VLAALALLVSRNATQGVLLGGIAGILGFWIMASRLEKLAIMNPQKVQFAALTLTSVRFLLYGAVFYKAFTLDQDSYHGLLGALVGFLAVRYTLVFVGVTGKDLKFADSAAENDSQSGDVPEKIQEEPDDSSKLNG